MKETSSAFGNLGFQRVKTNRYQQSRLITETKNLVNKLLKPHLKFKTHHNCRYSHSDFLEVITYAAIHRRFTEGSSNLLKLDPSNACPTADIILYHIKKFERRELVASYEAVIEEILSLAAKKGIFNKKVDVAIDTTEDLYYGDKDDPMVVGTKPKDGTARAFRYATLTVVEKGQRFTIKAIPMDDRSSKGQIVLKLLQYASERLKINNVYLDRGFYSVEVISTLNKLCINYVMPAVQHPKIQKIIRQHEAPYIGSMNISSKDTNTLTNLIIAYDRKSGEKRAFVTNIAIDRRDTRKLSDLYSKRWGIETSYRVTKDFRAKTTSKNYIIRLFYFFFSVCIYDLWQLVNIPASESIEKNTKKGYSISSMIFGNLLFNSFKWGGCGPPKRSKDDRHRKRKVCENERWR